jgi:predicted DCC family thiol-disulfide oxidoreductase YuxK
VMTDDIFFSASHREAGLKVAQSCRHYVPHFKQKKIIGGTVKNGSLSLQHQSRIKAFHWHYSSIRSDQSPTMLKLAPMSIATLFMTSLSVGRVGAWTSVRHSSRSSSSSSRSSLQNNKFFALSASLSSNPPLSGMDPSSSSASAAASASATNINAVVDWDYQSVANAAFTAEDSRPILLFDGVCNFCNGGVNLALDLDTTDNGVLRFASLQSITGQSLLMKAGKQRNDLSTVVLVESVTQQYYESEAVLRTAELLQGLPAPVRWISKLTRSIMPTVIRNAAYQVVGRNRYLFGERELSCRLDFDGSLQSRFLEDPADIVAAQAAQAACIAAAATQ